MLTRETRNVEQNVSILYCDRCGNECPKLDNMLSGAFGFDHGNVVIHRPRAKGGRGSFLLGQPHSDDECSLCLNCVKELREWLGRSPEFPVDNFEGVPQR